jgi:hypothetical protein
MCNPLCFVCLHYYTTDKAKKLTVLDDSIVQELAGEDAQAEKAKVEEAAKKQRKAKAGLEMRLAAEKKAQRKSKNKSDTTEVDMDDDDALLMFAKGSREKKSK